jgi:hypothetical protein
MPTPRLVLLVALCVVAGPARATILAQGQSSCHELVRGRVTADSARAVPNANVIVTRVLDRQFKSTTTDTDGRFSIDWPDGTGDYVVHVDASGFVSVTRALKRTGADSVLVADVRLGRAGAAQTLAPVVTRTERPQPSRDASGVPDVAASDYVAFPVNAARRRAPDQAGDLAAIAALAPGVLPVAGGISLFGLGSAQNSTTLNGMAFAAADVPRDAFTRVRVTSSSYDPSIGWFSGARTQVDLVPGALFTQRNAHATVDAPAAQWTDPVSARLGQQFTNFNGSIGGMGQLVDDEWAYNFGLQGGRKSSDFASLSTAGADLLRHVGVSSDSAARLLQSLAAAHVPLNAGGGSLGQVDDNVSFIGRVDHAPFDWKTLQAAKTTWGVTGYGKWSRTQGLGLGPTVAPAHAGQSLQTLASLQGEWSSYIRRDILADVRSSVSYANSSSDPYLRLPDGKVLVASDFPDGTGAVSTLLFGGNSALGGSSRTVTWESIADVQFYPSQSVKHKVRFTSDARFDATTQDVPANSLGSFAFNSLADLAANRPASYTRSLNSPARRGAAWNAFAAVGDVWRVSPSLQLKYGVRAEGNVFANAPVYNPAVQSVFGLRTDHAPNTAGLSPRLGLQYSVPGAKGRPIGTLTAGGGEFRNLIDPSLLAAAAVTTGLPTGLAQLSCFGSAAPAPDWARYAADPSSIPALCANGAPPSFTDAAPAVRVFDPSFTAARSWRGNLGWSSTALRSPYAMEITVSHNLNQRGNRELNFSGVPRFVTSDEGRPVFANASGIVGATGVVSPVDSRPSAAFGRVTDGVSDLRSETRQVTFTLRPYLGQTLGPYLGDFIVAYTLASIRDELRGFDQSTFADPASRDWARGVLDARHQFVVQGVVRPHPGWLLFFSGHVQSGMPYTPMVRTDVNGDGLANDRAFVFDPARTTDPALAAGMRDLLAHTSPQARDCLVRQFGRAAGRSSCEGPWSASFNASLRLDGGQVFHQDRMALTINFANPLGGLDQLLHGSSGLRGWGTRPAPDPVLLDVRGFDAGASRFLYAVNPRFGSTASATNTIRAPFRVTIDVSIDIAPPQAEQQLDRWLRPGRSGRAGTRVDAPDLARRYQRTVPDPYAEVLQETDSLLLTPRQITALQAADTRYRGRIDSIWVSVSQYLASLPEAYSSSAAFRRTDSSTDDAWEITRLAVQRDFREILTPDQQIMLPGLARQLFNARDRVHIRIFPRGG